jgi:hypothetical protein
LRLFALKLGVVIVVVVVVVVLGFVVKKNCTLNLN